MKKTFYSKECEAYFLIGESVSESKELSSKSFGIVKSIEKQNEQEQEITIEMEENYMPVIIIGKVSTAIMYNPKFISKSE